MKKVTVVILMILALTFTLASAQERDNPWNSTDIKVQIAETFSSRGDCAIEWDDAASGYWTGQAFYEWPDAQWKNGQLVLTNFPGLAGNEPSRFTFRIMTDEISNADISGSIGMGFYVENNTAKVQSIGFYMIGSASCLKNKNDTVLTFVDLNGTVTESVVTDQDMAMIPAGAKGYVIVYYEDFMNLWAQGAYDPSADPIGAPGFEITNMLIDGEIGESIVIDNVFYFGKDCNDNNSENLIDRSIVLGAATVPPTEEPETPTDEPSTPAGDTTEPAVDTTDAPTNAPEAPKSNGNVIIYVISAVILLGAIAAAAVILKKK